jgi:ABC-type bacteriocin/lantibiotic exporter with double-glycine peptidase domain
LLLKNNGSSDFMDFRTAVNRVLKRWYEQRIEEETERNRKLRELHDSLTRIKVLKEEQSLRQREQELSDLFAISIDCRGQE